MPIDDCAWPIPEIAIEDSAFHDFSSSDTFACNFVQLVCLATGVKGKQYHILALYVYNILIADH